MVGTPISRRVTRHRRTASIRALRAIANVSPVRPAERRAERNRLRRNRLRSVNANFYRGLLAYCGVPPQPRLRRQSRPPQPPVEQPVLISSDTSVDDLPQLGPQQPAVEVIDLESTLEDLGDLDITTEFPPPHQHQVLREAYVLLHRLQLPQARPLTPPPELPPHQLTPPPEQGVDWVGLEAAVAAFDPPQQHLVLPPVLVLQQPEVVPHPQFMPAYFAPPPPLPQVDWAMIAYALFTVAEREHQRRGNNP